LTRLAHDRVKPFAFGDALRVIGDIKREIGRDFIGTVQATGADDRDRRVGQNDNAQQPSEQNANSFQNSFHALLTSLYSLSLCHDQAAARRLPQGVKLKILKACIVQNRF
jgi:hypothetical protein